MSAAPTLEEFLDYCRGRSADHWIFKMHPPGRPIRPQIRVNFLQALKAAFRRLRHKEIYDLLFRGDILEPESCAGEGLAFVPYCLSPLSSLSGLTTTEAVTSAPTEPSERVHTPTEPGTPACQLTPTEPGTPARGLTPTESATPAQTWESPVWAGSSSPDLQEDSVFSPTHSPHPVAKHLSGLFANVQRTSHDGSPMSATSFSDLPACGLPSPTVTELVQDTPTGSPSSSALFEDAPPPKKIITYLRRDKDRFRGQQEGSASAPPLGGAASLSGSTEESTAVTAPPARLPLCLQRLNHWPHCGLRRSGRLARELVRSQSGMDPANLPGDIQVVSFEGGLRPLADRNFVIGGIVGAPLGDPAEVMEQLAPRAHTFMKTQVEKLEEHTGITPAFPNTAFSSAELTFGNSYAYERDLGWVKERAYLQKICNEYHAQIDWWVEDHEEPELEPYNPEALVDSEVLSDEEEILKHVRIKLLNQRIWRWFTCRIRRRRNLVSGLDPDKNPFVILLNKLTGLTAPPKARQAYQ
ncbi:hypothetical protein B0H16DRAFT_1717732 [Mycena metata]|uniref:Uncharacterized protein n=1 Tax=Mycena metata TaxID=1033252 RepID=A0AAD7JL74_9AGAR|nr:hypothetical protein B0H16DRAFT_1717732 [Mycena metata]